MARRAVFRAQVGGPREFSVAELAANTLSSPSSMPHRTILDDGKRHMKQLAFRADTDGCAVVERLSPIKLAPGRQLVLPVRPDHPLVINEDPNTCRRY